MYSSILLHSDETSSSHSAMTYVQQINGRLTYQGLFFVGFRTRNKLSCSESFRFTHRWMHNCSLRANIPYFLERDTKRLHGDQVMSQTVSEKTKFYIHTLRTAVSQNALKAIHKVGVHFTFLEIQVILWKVIFLL